jgi:hypothetical protein
MGGATVGNNFAAAVAGARGGGGAAQDTGDVDDMVKTMMLNDEEEEREPGVGADLVRQAAEGCFSLLQKLEDMENKMYVLKLLVLVIRTAAVTSEGPQAGIGGGPGTDGAAPAAPPPVVLQTVVANLQQVWESVEQGMGAGAGGSASEQSASSARLLAATLSVAASVVRAFGAQAVADAGFQALLWPLLRVATDTKSHSWGDVLLADGVGLWVATLEQSTALSANHQMVLANLDAMLNDDQDVTKALHILEYHILLGGQAFMADAGQKVAQVLDGAYGRVAHATTAAALSAVELLMMMFPNPGGAFACSALRAAGSSGGGDTRARACAA